MKFSEYQDRFEVRGSRFGEKTKDLDPGSGSGMTEKAKGQPQSDREFYVKNLAGDVCLCDRTKLRKNSFCYRCYKALPIEMQRALYHGLGHGYEAACDAAVVYLQKNVWE